MDILASHSPAWLAGLVLALVVIGAIAGLLAGLLDMGGGIVIVPVLYHPFTLLGIDESVRMHVTWTPRWPPSAPPSSCPAEPAGAGAAWTCGSSAA